MAIVAHTVSSERGCMTTSRVLIGALVLALAGFFIFKAMKLPESTTTNEDNIGLAELNLENWHEFNAPLDQFKVLLPILPQHATKTLTDPTTNDLRQFDMYVSEKENGTIFMISIVTFLDKESEKIDDTLLMNVVNDMLASSAQNQLKSLVPGNYETYPSIDFSIENDQVNIDGRVFLVDKTLFLLTSAAKRELYKRKEFEFFINSFELPPKVSTTAL